MRITVTIEDSLLEKVLEMADPEMDRAEIFREAIRTFVRVQAAKRLIAFGGTAPTCRTCRVIEAIRLRHEVLARPGCRST